MNNTYLFVDTKSGKIDYREDISLSNSITFTEHDGEEVRFDLNVSLNEKQVADLVDCIQDSVNAFISIDEYQKRAEHKYMIEEAICDWIMNNIEDDNEE